MYYRDLNKKEKNISVLLGQTIVKIIGGEKGDKDIIFQTSDNKTYLMYHEQDCCESVEVEDVTGNLSDLIGSPITMAEEVKESKKGFCESFTWTFYKLATVKGYVTIRWLGTSTGYYSYSETVDFVELYNFEIEE